MKDFYLAAIIGFSVGCLILLPLANIGFVFPWPVSIAIVVFFAIFGPLAFGIFKFLSFFRPAFEEIGKFAAVGTFNSLLDLGVVNLLIILTSVSAGWLFSLFKAISFLVASASSYFWNKFWTFQDRRVATWREYSLFLFFTFLGAVVNVAVASFLVNILGAPAGWNQKLWANCGILAATAASLTLNFFLYKKVVFRTK